MKFIINKLFAVFFILLLAENLFSQGTAIGQWRSHLPWNNCISITEGDGVIYCATKNAVFSLDKEDNSITRFTKVNYLSDIGVSRVAYHNETKTLIVSYSNGNLDLVENDKVTNIPDIKRKLIPGLKSINNILFIESRAYLSCGFGIVVLDIEKKEIKDTYYIGFNGAQVNVLDMTFDGVNLYAATESGMYDANINDPNLSDYKSWKKHDEMPQPDLKYNTIAYFNNAIYINYAGSKYNDDTLYVYKNGNWGYYNPTYSSNKYELKVRDTVLMVINEGDVDFIDTSGTILARIYTYNSTSIPYAPTPRDAIFDSKKNNITWIADANIGVIKNEGIWTSTAYQLNGPKTTNAFNIAAQSGNIWVAPGGLDATWYYMYNGDGIFSFINDTWTTFDKDSINAVNKHIYEPLLKQKSVFDIISVAINPSNPSNVYAGTWSKGLLEFNDQKLTTIYDTTNSTLDWIYRVGVAGVIFDKDNNLWVTNTGGNNVLHVKKSNGTWKAFDFTGYLTSSSTGEVGSLIIDKNNYKWIIYPRNSGMVVFNDNNTIDNVSDDQIRKISNVTGNGALPSNNIYSIAVDRDGEIWIGSDKGIAVIYTPENVFTGGNFDAQQILVDQGGFIQPLLESEIITAIAVDGGNRKWIGTQRTGVFLLSEDGTEQLIHFTEENSPLFSNTINCISIDHSTGEVYFGTDKGIISYKGDSTEPEPTYSNIVVYPNPVKENYEGVIAIKGLVENADIKITDISGTLIYHTIAKGGQATWDGKNYSGEKAKTGVYLVFSSNSDGSETIVTKILFIN